MKPTLLHAANPGPMTGDGNWTYLIGREHPVLIDAGVGHASHLQAIADAAPGGLSRLVVTHGHSDHITGAPAIHGRWPDAMLSKHPWPVRDPRLPWRRLDEGSIVATDDGDLMVLHTPGHSPDHVTLWHPVSRTLFVGDMLVQGSSVVIPASQGGSLAEYLLSLERMRQLNPARALPAHGPVIEDPVGLIQHYFEHRSQRERQILETLSQGPTTVERIAARIYPRITPELLPMAQESVLAHLMKLETEKRARLEGAHWALGR